MHQLKLTTLLSSVMKREHHLPPRSKTWEEPALQCQSVAPCMAWDCGTTGVLYESGSHRCIMYIMCITSALHMPARLCVGPFRWDCANELKRGARNA